MFGCYHEADGLRRALFYCSYCQLPGIPLIEKVKQVESIRKQLKGSSDQGFTLIELLVVVLILGILSVIAVVAVNNARTTAIQKACVSSASAYVNAYDQYAAQNTVTPPTTGTTYSSTELGTLLVDKGYLKGLSTSTDYSLTATYVAGVSGGAAAHITVAGSVAGCSAS